MGRKREVRDKPGEEGGPQRRKKEKERKEERNEIENLNSFLMNQIFNNLTYI